MRFTMFENEVVANPGHEMIFKRSLNQLVKNVGGQHLMNISAGEVIGEWLTEW